VRFLLSLGVVHHDVLCVRAWCDEHRVARFRSIHRLLNSFKLPSGTNSQVAALTGTATAAHKISVIAANNKMLGSFARRMFRADQAKNEA